MIIKIKKSKFYFLTIHFLSSSSLALLLFNNSTELNFDYFIQDVFFLKSFNNYLFLKITVSFLISILVVIIYWLSYNYFFALKSYKEKIFFAFLVTCGSLFSFLYFFRFFFLSRLYILIFVIVLTTVTLTFSKYTNINIVFVVLLFLINFGNILIQQITFQEEVVVEDVLSIPDYVLEEEFLNSDYEYLKFVYSDSKLLLNSKVKISDSYIYKYLICCENLNYEKMKKKSIGYLDSHESNLIYVTGSGFISYLKSSEIENDFPSFNTIRSNFHEIVNNKYISTYKNKVKSLNKESTKGMVILNDKIYISYLNEPIDNCLNVEIVVGDLNYEFIEFKPFFQPKECNNRDFAIFNSHAAGGKLVVIDDNHLGFTTGDFNIFGLSQDSNSIYGKIYSINVLNSELKLISSGHRNPQGLHKVAGKDILIETEHGPRGGDEINLINLNQNTNYGWPISSYGTHYSDQYYEDYGDVAPLNDSHSDFGFKEPLKYFPFNEVGPHGISDVEAVKGKEDTFFVATLYGKKIYEIKINFETQTIDSFTTHYVGERIRDIEFNPQTELYYILMEDSPAIGILDY